MTPSPPKESFSCEGLVNGNVRINGEIFQPKDLYKAISKYPHKEVYLREVFERTWDMKEMILKDLGTPGDLVRTYREFRGF